VRPPRPLRVAAGSAIALAIAVLIVLLLRAIAGAAAAGPAASPGPDIAHLLRMTSIQAGLSTVLSLAVGIALAWALNRLRFPGRGLLIGLFAAAIVTPGLVVAFGLLTVWGRAGWVSSGTAALFGIPLDLPLFGLGGILAAHTILDGAFAARILLARLDAIPAARLKTGQSLALSPWRRFAIIDWPAMRGTLPGLAAIIFLLAFTSFPIVLLLGGGPANQTLEVAIYSAVRLDFDLSAAVTLALVQIGVCGAIVLLASSLSPVPGSTEPSPAPRWRDAPTAQALQWAVLAVATAGFGLPLVAVLAGIVGPDIAAVTANPRFWSAVGNSIGLGTASALLALVLALGLGMARAAAPGRTLRLVLATPAYAYLAVPAMVLALGFFLLIRGLGAAPAVAAAPVIIVANALLTLPFATATLGPPLEAIAHARGRLMRSLGLGGRQQLMLVEWPLIGRDVGIVLALGFCFSLGDLGVISLFGTQDFTTLPLLMVRALGAYRSNEAAAIAAVMLVVAIAAFTALPALFARLAHARA
jgi:thiamine transport system permease protein